MKFRSDCLASLVFACLTAPAVAHSAPASKQVTPSPAQVKITKKDADEKVVAVQTLELSQAITLAAKLVPGAISKDSSAVKTLIITYD